MFIIEFLFDISAGTTGATCESAKEWGSMLLPSSKNLWSAQTKSEWEKEYVAHNHDQRPTFGHLLKHDDIQTSQQVGNMLDRWLTQVDDFGSLVVSATSLAENIE